VANWLRELRDLLTVTPEEIQSYVDKLAEGWRV
jgi:hypothetical protein